VTKGFDARLANRPFLVFDFWGLWRSGLSSRVLESQKLIHELQSRYFGKIKLKWVNFCYKHACLSCLRLETMILRRYSCGLTYAFRNFRNPLSV